jgi:hypothetical protein
MHVHATGRPIYPLFHGSSTSIIGGQHAPAATFFFFNDKPCLAAVKLAAATVFELLATIVLDGCITAQAKANEPIDI